MILHAAMLSCFSLFAFLFTLALFHTAPGDPYILKCRNARVTSVPKEMTTRNFLRKQLLDVRR